MNAAQKEEIVSKLAGTSGLSDSSVCDEYSISLEDLEELMLDARYERCSECDWWCEISELVDDDSEPCPCESCRGGGRNAD
jgi:hypothetical protein